MESSRNCSGSGYDPQKFEENQQSLALLSASSAPGFPVQALVLAVSIEVLP